MRKEAVMSRTLCPVLLALALGAAPAHANEIWIAPTHQQDLGGLGVGSHAIWPVTAAGVARLSWAIPDDLKTFQRARLVLIPQAAAAGATLTVYVCKAAGAEIVTAACAGPFTQTFSSTANQLLEIDVSAAIGPQIGAAGQNHLAVVAFTSSATTDRILGLRFAYDPVLPDGAATLGPNTFTGTQTAPAFAGNGAGVTSVNAERLDGLDASAFAASSHGHDVSQVKNAASLSANTLAGTQTINGGNLDLDPSSPAAGNITKNGVVFLHTIGGTFLGLPAGNDTMTGTDNIGIGTGALASITSGNRNVGLGVRALNRNTFAPANVAVGHGALELNETGSSNVAVGASALAENTAGGVNTAVGQNALRRSTGLGNTALGQGAGLFLVTGNNNLYLGSLGVETESNTTRIGDPPRHTRTFVTGIRGVTTGLNNAVAVLIDSAGQLGTVSSSRRYKEDVHDMGNASSQLLQLRPVTFRYATPFADGGKPIQFGLIAEEVAEVFPELVVRDDEGRPETVAYQNLSVLLLNELQRLQKRVEELERRLAGGR
jgi:hypothetical protein